MLLEKKIIIYKERKELKTFILSVHEKEFIPKIRDPDVDGYLCLFSEGLYFCLVYFLK